MSKGVKRYAATGRDVYIDVPLSNVAITYRPQNMVADQLAPIVPVMKQSGAYPIWAIADAYRLENDERAPGTEATPVTWDVSSDLFYCKNYALKTRVPWEDLENADPWFIISSREAKARRIKDKLVLKWESRVAGKVNSGTNVGSYAAVASAWNDHTSGKSDPIGDINKALKNVEDSTGIRPNRIAYSRAAWREFREHADVINRIYGTAGFAGAQSARLVTRENTKALFEVDEIIIAGAYKNTKDKGQTVSLSMMWGGNVLVYYSPSVPSIDDASFMYSFRWNKIRDLDMAATVRSIEPKQCDEIELGYYQDEKITAKELAFLITTTVSGY
jgi:hypothetical protein